ncbi:MAG TPA: hypothetical protein VL200_06580 [Lacunisphaera sp.]|jgi:hypothetical protein|nr:hypothetical protein [Lacunisphaera sp.]
MTTKRSDLISVESRSETRLQFKVAARRATGWMIDGDQLLVTDYTKSRPVKRYVQMMFRPVTFGFPWAAAH